MVARKSLCIKVDDPLKLCHGNVGRQNTDTDTLYWTIHSMGQNYINNILVTQSHNIFHIFCIVSVYTINMIPSSTFRIPSSCFPHHHIWQCPSAYTNVHIDAFVYPCIVTFYQGTSHTPLWIDIVVLVLYLHACLGPGSWCNWKWSLTPYQWITQWKRSSTQYELFWATYSSILYNQSAPKNLVRSCVITVVALSLPAEVCSRVATLHQGH